MSEKMVQTLLLRQNNNDNNENNNRRVRRRRKVNNNNPNTDLDHSFRYLPDDVVEKIFSFLPIKQAVRNGVVARQFERSWVKNRCFIFDKAFSRRVHTRTEFISIVNGVFRAHEGQQILTFHLYFDHTGADRLVRRWLGEAMKKGVEELDLDFYLAMVPFRFEIDFLNIQTLKTLKLSYCDLSFPIGFNPHRFLSTVVLRKVLLADGVVEVFFRNCPGLESLELIQCYGIQTLRVSTPRQMRFRTLRIGGCPELSWVHIKAPSLVSFYFHDQCRFLSLSESVSKLEDVILNFIPCRNFTDQCYGKVERLVSHHLRTVTVLTITSTFIEGWPAKTNGDAMTRDYEPSIWTNLKELQLFMVATSFCNLTDVASFLRSCAYLEKLFVDLSEFNFESGRYWELHQKPVVERYTAIFWSLRFIKISGFKFQKHEIDLVKFLLKKSFFLEELVLVFAKNDDTNMTSEDATFYCHLFHSWKLSRNAAISVYEYSNDQSCAPKHSKVWYK